MIKETMTSEQRVHAALNLQYSDRTPVIPQIYQFACKQKGLPIVPMAGGDPANWPKMMQAMKDNFDDLGTYDGAITAGLAWPITSWRVNSIFGKYFSKTQNDTSNNFEVQFQEKEEVKFEDYDIIINKGWNEFLKTYIPRETGLSVEQLDASEKYLTSIYMEDVKYWQARHVPVMSGAIMLSVEMTLSLGRTMPNFMMDVHRHPDKIKAAMEAMTPDFIDNCIKDIEVTKIPWVVFSMERGSGAYFNLKTYENLFFPQLKKAVDAFHAKGYTSILHFDTNWTKNLPYYLELPKKSCLCEFDSITDIFKAKEVLGNHLCIMGDVPASIQALGNKEEIIAYCEKLIDVCGKDGGFILSSGCEVPPNAKFENVKAMVDTAKTHVAPRSK